MAPLDICLGSCGDGLFKMVVIYKESQISRYWDSTLSQNLYIKAGSSFVKENLPFSSGTGFLFQLHYTIIEEFQVTEPTARAFIFFSSNLDNDLITLLREQEGQRRSLIH